MKLISGSLNNAASANYVTKICTSNPMVWSAIKDKFDEW